MIGIVGLGDLGGRLAMQALLTGHEVLGFDISITKNPVSAVDPNLDIKNQKWSPQVANLQELMDKSQIVHWTAPLEALENIDIPEGVTLILHNSVMHGSILAKKKLSSGVAVVHCLMNADTTVVVAEDEGDTLEICQHIRELGLKPKVMPSTEHDTIMAKSQGIFALLISHGLKSQLEEWHEDGLLTSSAEELLKAIEHRESQWTDVTIQAILSNPALIKFVEELNSDETNQLTELNCYNKNRND